MKPYIDSSFWSDPDIERAASDVKLAALWLITNSQTSLIGLCGASSARFEFETGLKAAHLESAIKALPRAFKRFGDVVFLARYIHHQFGRGDKLKRNNFFVALMSLFGSIKDPELRAFFLNEYPEFENEGRAPKGLHKPKDVCIGKEGMEEGMQGEGAIDIPGNPTEAQFIAECERYSIPAFYARDKFLAKDEKGWGRKWKQHVKRVSEWYVNDGRPLAPKGTGKPAAKMFLSDGI